VKLNAGVLTSKTLSRYHSLTTQNINILSRRGQKN
jgi:hypothetical protein